MKRDVCGQDTTGESLFVFFWVCPAFGITSDTFGEPVFYNENSLACGVPLFFTLCDLEQVLAFLTSRFLVDKNGTLNLCQRVMLSKLNEVTSIMSLAQ